MRAFVAANIFVRLLTGDDPDKARRSLDLFERVERGEIDLFTSEAVVGEVLYVLSSKRLYAQARGQIAKGIRQLIELPGLHIDHKQTILNAIDRWQSTSLGWAGSVTIHHSFRERLDAIFSYDEKLGRVAGVDRREP